MTNKLAKKGFTLTGRKTRVWKLISIDQNLKQIGLLVPDLLSDKQTNTQTEITSLYIKLDIRYILN